MPTYRARGASPQQIVNSVSRSIQRAVRDLRPITVSARPPSAEGNSEGNFGDHQYFIDATGAVRLYEKGISTNALPQWREIATSEVGGPVKYEINNTWDMTIDDESAIIIEQSGSGDASIEFEVRSAGSIVNRYSWGTDNSTTADAMVLWHETSTGVDSRLMSVSRHPTANSPKFVLGDIDDNINASHYIFTIYNGVGSGNAAQFVTNLTGTASNDGLLFQFDGSSHENFLVTHKETGQLKFSTDGTQVVLATQSRSITLNNSAGALTLDADLRVDGGDIGLTADTDLIQIAANTVTINGTLNATAGTGLAPSTATYIVQTANATLSAEQVLASLTTGLVKNTTTTGVLSIGVADTDYQQPVTWGDGLSYAAPTASVDFNSTNLKITAGQLNTIQDIATASSPTLANLTLGTGGALRTGTTLGNTAFLQAYDTDTGPAYTTFATLTAGTTPTMDLSTAVTVGGNTIQRDVTWGDGLGYSAPTASVDYNTTNLKITAAQLDTIQSIATAASPTFTGLTLSGLTASRLMATGVSSQAASVANLASWVAGTANQITVTDDLDGTITLSAPQSLATSAAFQVGSLNVTEGNITNVGDIALDSISADGTTITIGTTSTITLTSGGSIAVALDTGAGDDFTVRTTALVVEGDTGRVGIGIATPQAAFQVKQAADINLLIKGADSLGGAVGVSAINDANSANIPLEIRSSETMFSAGNVAIGSIARTHPLNVSGAMLNTTLRNSASHVDGLRVNKASTARLGTAVIDLTLAHCRVVFDIYVSYTASGNLTWQGEITATINSTNLGTTGTMVEHWNGSAGAFQVAVGDFVVTRPGGNVIRLTYTNNNSAGADPNRVQVSARVFTLETNDIPTISIT